MASIEKQPNGQWKAATGTTTAATPADLRPEAGRPEFLDDLRPTCAAESGSTQLTAGHVRPLGRPLVEHDGQTPPHDPTRLPRRPRAPRPALLHRSEAGRHRLHRRRGVHRRPALGRASPPSTSGSASRCSRSSCRGDPVQGAPRQSRSRPQHPGSPAEHSRGDVLDMAQATHWWPSPKDPYKPAVWLLSTAGCGRPSSAVSGCQRRHRPGRRARHRDAPPGPQVRRRALPVGRDGSPKDRSRRPLHPDSRMALADLAAMLAGRAESGHTDRPERVPLPESLREPASPGQVPPDVIRPALKAPDSPRAPYLRPPALEASL